MIWRCGENTVNLGSPRVMGIVNVTPDSFSDGGMYARPEEAVRRARHAAAEGAALIDFGAESTRPGATPLAWADEWARLEPVLSLLAEKPLPVPFSVDTYHVETARRAIAAGAAAVNCVKRESGDAMVALANETGAGLILPSRTADEARIWLDGLDEPSRLAVDPEIGFGTTREEDIALLRGIGALAAVAPVCAGISRKRIVKHLTGAKAGGKDLAGSLALALWCAARGAALLRVHDVGETVRALAVLDALAEGRPTA